ncbi:MAG: hypothetical protein ACFCVD_19665 [Nodosilinea sp.]
MTLPNRYVSFLMVLLYPRALTHPLARVIRTVTTLIISILA